MSLKIMSALMESNIPATPCWVAVVIANFANTQGEAWPTLDTIIERSKLSKRTVTGAIASLKKNAVITAKSEVKRGIVYTFDYSRICYLAIAKSANEDSKICYDWLGEDSKICYKSIAKSANEPARYIIENQKQEPLSIAASFDTAKKKSSGAEKKVLKKSREEKPPKPKKEPFDLERERDALFDAIAEVCCMEPKIHGSVIGRAKKELQQANFTPEEVRLFGKVYAKQHPNKQIPTWTELKSRIGIVRNPRAMERVFGHTGGYRNQDQGEGLFNMPALGDGWETPNA